MYIHWKCKINSFACFFFVTFYSYVWFVCLNCFLCMNREIPLNCCIFCFYNFLWPMLVPVLSIWCIIVLTYFLMNILSHPAMSLCKYSLGVIMNYPDTSWSTDFRIFHKTWISTLSYNNGLAVSGKKALILTSHYKTFSFCFWTCTT